MSNKTITFFIFLGLLVKLGLTTPGLVGDFCDGRKFTVHADDTKYLYEDGSFISSEPSEYGWAYKEYQMVLDPCKDEYIYLMGNKLVYVPEATDLNAQMVTIDAAGDVEDGSMAFIGDGYSGLPQIGIITHGESVSEQKLNLYPISDCDVSDSRKSMEIRDPSNVCNGAPITAWTFVRKEAGGFSMFYFGLVVCGHIVTGIEWAYVWDSAIITNEPININQVQGEVYKIDLGEGQPDDFSCYPTADDLKCVDADCKEV